MDINAEIQYVWNFGWDRDNMSQSGPKVNLLLKAMLDKNVEEMERLFQQGATLEKADKETLGRVVFHILDEYDVVHCMTKHGFVGYIGKFVNFSCIGEDGYSWDLMARAWYLKRYDVLELLAENGFEGVSYCINGSGEDIDRLIVIRGDVKAANILMEYGYPRYEFERYQLRYPDSKVIRYLQENPVIKRKIGVLDPFKYKEIPYPSLEKPSFFNKKKVEVINRNLKQDYEDRIEAQKRFKALIGETEWKNVIERNRKSDELFVLMANDLL